MSHKDSNAAKNTIPRDLQELQKETGNIYYSVVVLSKRADQVNDQIREELNEKLEDFVSASDNLEEIFENREQIEISRFYERLPKPSSIAIEELLEGKIYFRNPAYEKKGETEESEE